MIASIFIINSIISFWFLGRFILFITSVFKKINKRLSYWLFFLPIIYLPLSLSYYSFTPRYLKSIIHLPENSRTLSLEVFKNIQCSLTTDFHYVFTPGDLLCELVGKTFMAVFAMTIIFVSALFSFRKIHQIISSLNFQRSLRKKSVRQHKKIFLTSDLEIISPFAGLGKSPYILFPLQVMKDYSQEEVRAMLQHEKAHLLWMDPYFHLLLEILCAIFWFIPGISIWKKSIIIHREQAADAFAKNTGCSAYTMAQVIYKTAAKQKSRNPLPLNFSSEKNQAIKRVRYLMSCPSSRTPRKKYLWSAILFCIAAYEVLTCKFFVF